MKNIYFKRKNNRIPQYDYSNINYYFVTICTKDKKCIFGYIKDERMYQTSIGEIIEDNIIKIDTIYKNIYVDDYVVMPNHLHMIISITTKSEINVSRIINQFKGKISKEIGHSIWQKSFYDHVIRNEKDYLRIREYIGENILKWNLDEYHS